MRKRPGSSRIVPEEFAVLATMRGRAVVEERGVPHVPAE